MSEKPRRAWFQIHLSTGVVMMLVFSAFVGLNVQPDYSLSSSQTRIAAYGWPILLIEESTTPQIPMFYRYELFNNGFSSNIGLGFFIAATLNLSAAITVTLAILGILKCGWWRKTDEKRSGNAPRFKIRAVTVVVMLLTTALTVLLNFTIQEWMICNETQWFGWPTNSAVINKAGVYIVWPGVINNLWICTIVILAAGSVCEVVLRWTKHA